MPTFNQEDIDAVKACITECISLPFGGFAYKVDTDDVPEPVLNKVDFITEGGKGGAIEEVEEAKSALSVAEKTASEAKTTYDEAVAAYEAKPTEQNAQNLANVANNLAAATVAVATAKISVKRVQKGGEEPPKDEGGEEPPKERQVSVKARQAINQKNINIADIPGDDKITMRHITKHFTVILFFLMSFTGMSAQEVQCCEKTNTFTRLYTISFADLETPSYSWELELNGNVIDGATNITEDATVPIDQEGEYSLNVILADGTFCDHASDACLVKLEDGSCCLAWDYGAGYTINVGGLISLANCSNIAYCEPLDKCNSGYEETANITVEQIGCDIVITATGFPPEAFPLRFVAPDLLETGTLDSPITIINICDTDHDEFPDSSSWDATGNDNCGNFIFLGGTYQHDPAGCCDVDPCCPELKYTIGRNQSEFELPNVPQSYCSESINVTCSDGSPTSVIIDGVEYSTMPQFLEGEKTILIKLECGKEEKVALVFPCCKNCKLSECSDIIDLCDEINNEYNATGSGAYTNEILWFTHAANGDGIDIGDVSQITLPNGDVATLTVANTIDNDGGATNASDYTLENVPAWAGSAINGYYNITNGVYYSSDGNHITVEYSVTVKSPNGCTYEPNIVVVDGEAMRGGERLIFTTDGGGWTVLENVNGSTYGNSGIGTNVAEVWTTFPATNGTPILLSTAVSNFSVEVIETGIDNGGYAVGMYMGCDIPETPPVKGKDFSILSFEREGSPILNCTEIEFPAKIDLSCFNQETRLFENFELINEFLAELGWESADGCIFTNQESGKDCSLKIQ